MTDNRTNEQIVAERLAHVPDECSCHRSTAMDLARDAVDALKGAGRLAGEPTDEQVEAAAQAVREVDARAGLIADVDLPMYRARAALEAAARAAQGAAPQAPPNLRRIISEALREAYSWSEGTQAVYDVIFPLFTVPVLPSSGVDEEKLAAVIGKVTDSWDEPLDEVHDIPQIARAVAAWLKDGAR